jgi:hypothetical protein
MRPAPKDCCSTCWVNERSGQINVFDDMLLGGNQIRERPITFVRLFNPNGSRHYRGKYHVEVKQLSLTREAYNYWSSIKEQIVSSGSIFEPPPFAIIGNMTNTSNAEDPVFGYFGASSISKKDIIIPASEAPFPMYDTLIWSDDCRALSNSTPYKPSFW